MISELKDVGTKGQTDRKKDLKNLSMNNEFTIVVEDLHARLKELHGRGFEVLLALVQTADDFGQFRLADQHREAGDRAAHEVGHPALRSCVNQKIFLAIILNFFFNSLIFI